MPATPLSERALGPDLARGLMLLWIALANVHFFLDAPQMLGGFPQGGTPLDQAVTWAISTFVDGRAYPLFGLLVGYGVAQVVRRNPLRPRNVLFRRALALIAIGWVHAILLYIGDVLALYGMLLAGGALVVFWRDRWLLLLAATFLVITTVPAVFAWEFAQDGPPVSFLPPDVETLLRSRLPEQLLIMLIGPMVCACAFLLGLVAGRRGLLERPGRLLRWIAIVGIAVGVLGGQPYALLLAGQEPLPTAGAYNAASALHYVSGMFAGAGYAAAITLIAPRLPHTRVVGALAATGQRSMTAYLSQSVVWAIVFTPFLLGLADDLSITAAAVLATLTWLASVVLCDRLARAGRRGPFEALLRRATYGRRPIA